MGMRDCAPTVLHRVACYHSRLAPSGPARVLIFLHPARDKCSMQGCKLHMSRVPGTLLGEIRQDAPQQPLQELGWQEWRHAPMPQAGGPGAPRTRSDVCKVRRFASLHVRRRSRCISMNCPFQSAQGSLSPLRSRHPCVVFVSHALSCQRSYRGHHYISRTLCLYPSKLTVAARGLCRFFYFAWQVHSPDGLRPRQAHLCAYGVGAKHKAKRPAHLY